MAVPALKPLDIDDFLAWESGDDRVYELVDGFPMAMAPALRAHQILAMNLGRRLGEALDSRPPCTVAGEAPIAVPGRNDVCHIADLVITCAPHEPGQRLTPDPSIIVEILSPSTENRDRRVKLLDYRAIPSVEAIVLIDPQQLYCEVHHRQEGGRWLVDLLREPDALLRLPTIDFEQPLSAIYANIALTS